MGGKTSNTLRMFHLLVLRAPEGFIWQVRFNRHADPVERGPCFYKTYREAENEGERALKRCMDAARKRT